MKAEKKQKATGIIASIKTLLKNFNGSEEENEVTNTSLTLDDGTEIYFAEDEIAVDVKVFSDEEMNTPLATGDYLYNDGDTIAVTDGVVTAITPKVEAAAVEETDAEKITRLENELATANSNLAIANKRADDNESLVDDMTEQLEAAQGLLNTVKTNWKPQARGAQPAKPANGVKKIVKPAANNNGTSLKDSVKAEKEARKAAAKK